ncbi:MAG: hypothetical protein ACXIUQ_18665 [Cecembia sp.]|jgi:hypothetical protein
MNIKKIGFGFLMSLMVVITACVDFIEPNVPYATFNTGLYLRTISGGTGQNWSIFELPTSRFNMEIEAVDAEEGQTLETVEIFVRHRRLIAGVGFEYIPAGSSSQVNQVLIGTMTRADFQRATENPNHPTTRYLRGSFSISAAEVVAALGVSFADIEGADAFEFRLRATDRFGRVFTDTNRSPDVQGGFFYRSPFRYDVPVVCPSDLGGTFRFQSTDMSSAFGSCPGTIEGEVTFTPVSGTTSYIVSDATFGFWDCYGDAFDGGEVRLNDACGRLSFSGTDKYGDQYTFNFISNDGSELVFVWVNSSNETGRVTLFANEGRPWPSGLR